jgi:serine/threonine-protein kinase HipA
VSTARACGIAEDVAQTLIDELVANTPAVIARVTAVLPTTFPAQIADAVFAGTRAAATKLAAAR